MSLSKKKIKAHRKKRFKATADTVYHCRGCGRRLTGKDFYFDWRYSNGRDLGECKACHKEIVRDDPIRRRKYKKQRQYNNARTDFFECRTCGEMKRGHQFVFHYRFYRGVYVTACKACKRKKDKEYYERNKRSAGD